MITRGRGAGRAAGVVQQVKESWALARAWWLASPGSLLGVVVLIPVGALLATSATYLSGGVITALDDGSPWSAVLLLTTVLIAVLVVTPMVESGIDAVAAASDMALTRHLHRRLAETAVTPDGIGHLEDPVSATALANLTDAVRDWRSLSAVQSAVAVGQARIGGVASVLLIGVVWNWWVPVAVALAEALMGNQFRRYIAGVMTDLNPPPGSPRRRVAYLADLLTTAGAAREVRMFGLTGWVLHRWQGWWDQALTDPNRPRALRRGLAFSPLLVLAYLAALGLLALDLSRGALTAGDALIVLQATTGLTLFGMLGDHQSATIFAGTTACRLDEFHDRHAGNDRGDRRVAVTSQVARPADDRAAFAFDDVRFCYPGAGRPVLDGFSLSVEPGSTVALVGPNGAGKSTVISLLAGLRRPGSGRITVAGREPDPSSEQVSVILQDFARYPLPLLDNIEVGHSDGDPVSDREARARAALVEAGAGELLDRIDLDTVLSPGYEGGTDLSGGQWQRVALARAFAALQRGSTVLVLDEPTSALDIRAEAELFDRFAAGTAAVTTILVTHRLSSVRAADRIVVLDEGRVVEDGSHDDLIIRDGLYARMFTVQAARFAAQQRIPADDHDGDR